MTVKKDKTLTPKPDNGLEWWLNCNNAAKKGSLLLKAYNFVMAFIYLNGCNSNKKKINLAKAYEMGHNNYSHILEEVCNVHQTVRDKPNKKKKNDNNDCNLKSDNTYNNDDNGKKDDKTENERNLVTAHIARYDEMNEYEQASALIDDRHSRYTTDNGYNNDVIYLHVTDIGKLYKPNNVELAESKKSNQTN